MLGKNNTGSVVIDLGGDSPLQSCRILHRRLRGQYSVELDPEISASSFTESTVLLVAGCEKFWDENDCRIASHLVNQGCSIIVFGSEFNHGQSPHDSMHRNIAPLLRQFGLGLGRDSIVRSVYSPQYFHPKEALIEDTCLSDEFANFIGRQDTSAASALETGRDPSHTKVCTVYPFGCSVTFEPSSRCGPFLSGRDLCLPRNRAIGAMSLPSDPNRGCVAVIGSHRFISDDYIMKEQNLQLILGLIRFCMSKTRGRLKMFSSDDQAAEHGFPLQIPQISSLAERPRVCLQELEQLPSFKELFNTSQFSFTNELLPQVAELYGELNVKHEALTLIPPQFEVPLPELKAAVFPPSFLEPPPPPLELFDIDSDLAGDSDRLKQLYMKCAPDDDVESFLQGSAEILGFSEEVGEMLADLKTAPGSKVHLRSKAILHFIIRDLAENKLIDAAHLMEQQSLNVEGNSINSQSWNMHAGGDVNTMSPDRMTHETEETLVYHGR